MTAPQERSLMCKDLRPMLLGFAWGYGRETTEVLLREAVFTTTCSGPWACLCELGRMNAVDGSIMHPALPGATRRHIGVGVVKLETFFCTSRAANLQGSMPQALTCWITQGSLPPGVKGLVPPPNLVQGFTEISHSHARFLIVQYFATRKLSKTRAEASAWFQSKEDFPCVSLSKRTTRGDRPRDS
jgi:hypothetical protein